MKKKNRKVLAYIMVMTIILGTVFNTNLVKVYAATTYGDNLVVNGSGEASTSPESHPHTGWNSVDEAASKFVIADINTTSVVDCPGGTSSNRFDYYPNSEDNDTLSQIIDVSDRSTDIDKGAVKVDLSGYIIKYWTSAGTITATIQLEMLNSGGTVIDSCELTSDVAASSSTWTLKNTSTVLNPNTRTLRVSLIAGLSSGANVASDYVEFDDIKVILTPMPLINVKGNNTNISNGDTTPTTTDDTDFGSTPTTGGSVAKTFTIENIGLSDLYLGGTPKVDVSGSGASSFTVSTMPTSPVAPSGTTSFQVTFDPTSDGVKTASLTISNNTMSNNSFVFDITGTGLALTPLQTVSGVTLSSSGIASWSNLSNEAGYSVQLYKNGVASGSPVAVAADVTTCDFLSAMRTGQVGAYTVKVTAKGDGTTYGDGAESSASTPAINILKPATVTAGLTWSGNTAQWTEVANAVNYEIKLYNGATLVDTKTVAAVSAGATGSADFTTEIAADIVANGGGTYTYKVTPKGNATLILDGDQSGSSNNNIKAIELAKVAGVTLSTSGVAGWFDVENETNYSVQLYKDGIANGVAVSIALNTTSHDFLSVMRAGGAGSYTVKVTAIGNGTTYSDGDASDASTNRTIQKPATVTILSWTGNVAHWTAVANAVSYDVELYKEGLLVGGATKNILPANVASGADFSTEITNGGGGSYTFKVTPKGDTDLIINGDQSGASNTNLIATPLAQVVGVTLSSAGIASWTNAANESGYSVQLYKGGVAVGSPVVKNTDELSHDFIAAMRAEGVGNYTVKVTAKGDGTNYSDGIQSADSAIQAVTKLVSVTAGITWSGDNARWTEIANAVSYDVQLYKNGNSLGSPKNVAAVSAGTTQSADFSTEIAINGGGTYTYKVTPKGNTTLILDGDESVISNNNIKAIALAKVAGAALSASGIATWGDVANESSYDIQLYKDGNPQGGVATETSDTVNHNFLADMRSAGVGVYTVKVTANGDGTYYSDGIQSDASASQTVLALAMVTAGLTWSGDVAHWTQVANAVSYDVQLYKEGNAVAGGNKNVLAANVAAGADFANEIANEGGGVFTYKVTAKGAVSTLFLDANQSVASNAKTVATPLVQVTGVTLDSTGVASWNNASNETGYSVQLLKNGSSFGVPVSKGADVVSHNFLTAMRTEGAGLYTVKVTAIGDGTNYSNGPQSAASTGQTVVKPVVVTGGLTWNSDNAQWTEVANAVNYDVQLYKNGNALGSPKNINAASADFGTEITSSGGGTYTYKVTPKGNATLVLDGDQSVVSNNNIKSIQLTKVTGESLSSSGVASWDDVANESGYEVQLYKDGNPQGVVVSKATNEITHSFLGNMRAAGAGVYTVKITAKGNGTTYSDAVQSNASSSQTVIQLANVSAGLTWAGNIAHWTPVADAVSYDIELFKAGNATTTKNILAANTAAGADLSSEMASAGQGTYTYKVTAKGNNTLILSATQSTVSDDNSFTPPPAPPAPVNPPAAPTATPKTEQITVDVTNGSSDETVSKITIERTTQADGTKKDTVTYDSDKAKETLEKLKDEGKDIARIVVPDEKNQVSETNVNIPSNTLGLIADGNINLEIHTEYARISVPNQSLQNASDSMKDDLFFQLVPVKKEDEAKVITDRAEKEAMFQLVIKDDSVFAVGKPMKIHTNMPSSKADIIIPLNNSDIPTNAKERAEFLSKLGVFIEHSDGTKELVRGEIVEYAPGVVGIKFGITKFSIFTIVGADSLAKSNACTITKVKTPLTAKISKTSITANVKNNITSVKVDVTVSQKATWKLYSDKACKKVITSKKMSLNEGSNKAYIKVTAQDGNSTKVYTITVNRDTNETASTKILFIATKSSYTDAYAGEVLAKQVGGEIITIGKTAKEVQTVINNITNNYSVDDSIYILGLGKAIKNDVETILKEKGYKNIKRIGGEDKYETAQKIAEKLNPKKGTKVVLVNGDKMPADGTNISETCAENGYPILYVKLNSLTDYTIEALKEIEPSQIYLVGDKKEISDTVVKELQKELDMKAAQIVRIESSKDLK